MPADDAGDAALFSPEEPCRHAAAAAAILLLLKVPEIFLPYC